IRSHRHPDRLHHPGGQRPDGRDQAGPGAVGGQPGHNLGEDVSYSGTGAGALPGLAMGSRSIALRQSLGRCRRTVAAHAEAAGAGGGQPGHNLGEDVSYSGTAAGALQGMAMGIRSIALSQSLERFHDTVVAHWETAEAFAPGIIQRLLDEAWADGVVMNVNFP